MSTVPNQHGLHFPDYTDSPDVPKDLSLLAKDIADLIDANPGPAGKLAIGAVTSLPNGSNPTVVNVGTSEDAILNIGIPIGIVGGPGPANSLSVLSTSTSAAGTQAQVSISSQTIVGGLPTQTLTFTIPRGDKGDQGTQGTRGDIGLTGPASATIAVQSTSTGAAGTQASVTNSGTSSAVQLNFTIPRGDKGEQGTPGTPGANGLPGADGLPGANANIDPVDTSIGLNIPTTNVYGVNSNWYPRFNNLYSIGQPIDSLNGVTTNRFWKTIYSNTGTINSSDSRLKTNVQDSLLGLDFINSLRPVSYKFIEGSKTEDGSSIPGERTHWGLIAQEVQSVIEEAGVDFAGWVLLDKTDTESEQALRYEEFIAPLIKAVQELTARVKSLEG